jgi:hypothetical protein
MVGYPGTASLGIMAYPRGSTRPDPHAMAIIVGETQRTELKAAVSRARAHPVRYEELNQTTTARDASAEIVKLPFGYMVAIAFEEQPAGLCLHISVSGPWPRVPPNMVVCAMVFSALDLAPEADDVWTEELLIEGNPNSRVFNALWVIEPALEQRPRHTNTI